ncbi:unnamed protein product [Schistocephalus solidus]|uniref:Uncharacterized protein n=1 Tax=Schistocephalus solidus TaxID=70667 RepID=A0A183T6Z2_SCHSO|nr:unnamed protein product [Schistocephalus solidus]
MARQDPDTTVLERTGILSIHVMLRQVQLRWSDHLVRVEDERLPKRIFYGGVATGARRHGDQKRRYKDTLKKSLKQLQINQATWEDLAQDRPAWRRSVKTGAAIYEANRITTAKAKRAARKSPAPQINTANAQALPMCPRCQRTFHESAWSDIFGRNATTIPLHQFLSYLHRCAAILTDSSPGSLPSVLQILKATTTDRPQKLNLTGNFGLLMIIGNSQHGFFSAEMSALRPPDPTSMKIAVLADMTLAKNVTSVQC